MIQKFLTVLLVKTIEVSVMLFHFSVQMVKYKFTISIV